MLHIVYILHTYIYDNIDDIYCILDIKLYASQQQQANKWRRNKFLLTITHYPLDTE